MASDRIREIEETIIRLQLEKKQLEEQESIRKAAELIKNFEREEVIVLYEVVCSNGHYHKYYRTATAANERCKALNYDEYDRIAYNTKKIYMPLSSIPMIVKHIVDE